MGGGFKDESNIWGVDEVVLGPNPIPIPIPIPSVLNDDLVFLT